MNIYYRDKKRVGKLRNLRPSSSHESVTDRQIDSYSKIYNIIIDIRFNDYFLRYPERLDLLMTVY